MRRNVPSTLITISAIKTATNVHIIPNPDPVVAVVVGNLVRPIVTLRLVESLW